MIIGSAIFGYSIAGVVIAIWKPHEKYSLGVLLSYATLAWSVSMVLCYIVMNEVPFGFGKLYREPLTNIFYFTIWYLSLLIPFSLSGFIVASLLTVFKERSNRLYAADLLGAGLGCLIVVPMFPPLGAGGIYYGLRTARRRLRDHFFRPASSAGSPLAQRCWPCCLPCWPRPRSPCMP
jgi:hypothetical protein